MILVHICCSVDSHYFLQRLQEDYPKEKIISFFYDPNIHPYSEYKLRLEDVKYSCNKLDIKLIEGDYDLEHWLKITKGLENEPEKGDRCTVCFNERLEKSIKQAKELNCDKFTTTLLISPKKSQDKLHTIGMELSKQYGIEFIFKDYRSGQGMQIQSEQVKQNKLYRQNYCGCLYALSAQREEQNKLADELISPINKQILPESIEERIELYKQRALEQNLNIIKQRFLNYRLLSGKVLHKKTPISSYFLCYSTLKNKKTSGKVENIIDETGYFNRDEVKIITIEKFNKLANTKYKNVLELYYNPVKFEDELNIRNNIVYNSFYDLSCIVVLDYMIEDKLDIYCDSKVYEDVKEALI